MALRLAGEDYSIVRGLDGLGWLREIAISSSDAALKVAQQGAGDVVEFLDGTTSAFKIKDGSNVKIAVGDTPNEIHLGTTARANLLKLILNGAGSQKIYSQGGDLILDGAAIRLDQHTTIFSGKILTVDKLKGGGTTLDLQSSIVNTSASNGGAVVIDDAFSVLSGNIADFSGLVKITRSGDNFALDNAGTIEVKARRKSGATQQQAILGSLA